MSKYLITDSQLNNLCIYLYSNDNYYYTYVKNYFRLMYLSGCRISESIDPLLWQRSSLDTISLAPLKFNNTRIFLISDIQCFLIDNLLASNFSVFDLNYSKVNYHILNQIRSYDITIKDKNSSCHLFRHNFAKQLKISGKSDNEIKLLLGERNQSSANEYIYSQIYSVKPLNF